mmetsp:Transcript_88044/g.284273  ORF Transcript_88044/g.284273 Transcript_88044/m.284273 type:complete len:258 (+) Transcript_88044:227-1000(+)
MFDLRWSRCVLVQTQKNTKTHKTTTWQTPPLYCEEGQPTAPLRLTKLRWHDTLEVPAACVLPSSCFGGGRLQHLAALRATGRAAAHGDSEGRLAVFGHGIGVGAALQQQREHGAEPVACRRHQWRAAARRRQVRVRTSFDERRSHLQVVRARRIAQGRPAVLVLGVQVAAVLGHQGFDLVHLALMCSKHQGVRRAHGSIAHVCAQHSTRARVGGGSDLAPAAPAEQPRHGRAEQKQRQQHGGGAHGAGHGDGSGRPE